MSWLCLFLAGAFEIVFAVALKYSEGFSRLIPSVVTCVCAILSFALLNVSLIKLPVGTAYAVWTGIGAVGSVAVGILIFKEPVTAARMFFTVLLLTGIVGIKLTSSH